jgi:hypothetical protein
VMIWSHLPRRVKEDSVVGRPVDVPGGTWYVNKVVRCLVW